MPCKINLKIALLLLVPLFACGKYDDAQSTFADYFHLDSMLPGKREGVRILYDSDYNIKMTRFGTLECKLKEVKEIICMETFVYDENHVESHEIVIRMNYDDKPSVPVDIWYDGVAGNGKHTGKILFIEGKKNIPLTGEQVKTRTRYVNLGGDHSEILQTDDYYSWGFHIGSAHTIWSRK